MSFDTDGRLWLRLTPRSTSSCDTGFEVIELPSEYVTAGHVDYAYATTVHKAQGVTVDRAITIIDTTSTAEAVYVGATRGREHNLMLAVTEPGYDEYRLHHDPVPHPTEVIAAALQRDTLERTATEVLRQNHPPERGLDLAHVELEPEIIPPVDAPALGGRGLGFDPVFDPDDRDGIPYPSPPAPEPAFRAPTPPLLRRVEFDDELLTGAEIRELSVQRYRLQAELAAAGEALRETRAARQVDQRELGRLNEGIGWERKMIDQTLRRIDQIRDRSLWQSISMSPADRIRDRKEIFGLEQKIVNHEAAITGIGFMVRRQERAIDRAEHSLGGRAGDQDRYERTRTRVEAEIERIDDTLDADLGVRAQRVLDHGPDQALLKRHRLDATLDHVGDKTIGQWASTIARVEQHHSAWDSIDLDSHRHDELGMAKQRSLHQIDYEVTQLDRAINPPSLHIGPERGFGISL